MTEILFTATARGKFSGGGITCQCALGRGGVIGAAQKREGDGTSPLGKWRMKRVFYRPDRVERPETVLPTIPLRELDGWCDAPEHPLYNRPVRLPFEASHERLWRNDHVYDLIVEIAHNDDPVEPYRGSAVFLHLSRDDFRPTEGCVAIPLDYMRAVLRIATAESYVQILY
ncbi:MAG: L,D-transpeptidase family protein [Pseudomonadota bacterium]